LETFFSGSNQFNSLNILFNLLNYGERKMVCIQTLFHADIKSVTNSCETTECVMSKKRMYNDIKLP